MSSAEAQVVYQKQDGLSGLEEQQSAFTEQFDVEDPEQAKSDYQRLIHAHTMAQFRSATSSARRSSGSTLNSDLPTPPIEQQSRGSVSSNSSL